MQLSGCPKKGGAEMAIRSEAQKKAVAKYNAANYEQIQLRVEKGKKDVIKAFAESRGESLNGFINRAIDEAMQRDEIISLVIDKDNCPDSDFMIIQAACKKCPHFKGFDVDSEQPSIKCSYYSDKCSFYSDVKK